MRSPLCPERTTFNGTLTFIQPLLTRERDRRDLGCAAERGEPSDPEILAVDPGSPRSWRCRSPLPTGVVVSVWETVPPVAARSYVPPREAVVGPVSIAPSSRSSRWRSSRTTVRSA